MSDKRFLKTALKPAVEEEKLKIAKKVADLARAQTEGHAAIWTTLPSEYTIKRRNEYEFSRRERALKAAVKAHRKQNGRIGPHVSVLEIAQWLLVDQEPWKLNGDKV